MSNYVSGPILTVLGVVEVAVGKAKEIVGIVFNRDDVVAAARAQQDKGQAHREEGVKLVEAQEASAAAKVSEEREHAAKN
jgi:hypothetical protein